MSIIAGQLVFVGRIKDAETENLSVLECRNADTCNRGALTVTQRRMVFTRPPEYLYDFDLRA